MLKLKGRAGIKYRMLPVVRLAFSLAGKKWTDFYAWMLNYQERNSSMEEILRRNRRDLRATPARERGLYDISLGEVYVDLLKREGLEPDQAVLDFGCGYGRVAIPLLRYLEPGKFVGVDLSEERIRLAREYVEIEGLQDTRPEFHVSKRDNSFDYLGNKKFNMIWSRAVLGHMPLDDIRICLRGLRKLLAPGGLFIGDYDTTTGGQTEIVETNVKTFQVPEAIMRRVVEDAGFHYGEIPDWEDLISPEEKRPYIRMMRLSSK